MNDDEWRAERSNDWLRRRLLRWRRGEVLRRQVEGGEALRFTQGYCWNVSDPSCKIT